MYRAPCLRESTLCYKVSSMGTLTRFFFRAPYAAPRTGEIWRWWESRRLAYNAAVLAAGATTVGAVFLMELLTPGRPRFPHPLIILIYAVLANLFFTLGPIADSLIMKVGGREYSEAGPMLFRYGFVFAVLLTLLPIPVTALRIFLGVIL
jgi:hypothetical protein